MARVGALRIQPSEFAKIGQVVILAAYFAARQREIKTFMWGFWSRPFSWWLLWFDHFTADFGTCFLCGAVAATMMFNPEPVYGGYCQSLELRWLPFRSWSISTLFVFLE